MENKMESENLIRKINKKEKESGQRVKELNG